MTTPDEMRATDAEYRAFPEFSEWLAQMEAHPELDEAVRGHLELLESGGRDRGREAVQIAVRATAVDTGVLEDLYEVDRGVTFTVAQSAALFEAHFGREEARVRRLVDAQLGSFERVIDMATGSVEIAEAWIRSLHEEVCAGQEYYLAQTPTGPQEQRLRLGEYKSNPNHVRLPDGTAHAYAPVELTPDEMHRLVRNLRSDEFIGAAPIVQAAYAHYALVVVHPFADGNGRVARALASVFTYRGMTIPLMVSPEEKSEYLAALRIADDGQFRPFVSFLAEQSVDCIEFVAECHKSIDLPTLEEATERLRRRFSTDSGLSLTELDARGSALLKAFHSRLKRLLEDGVDFKELRWHLGLHANALEAAMGRRRLSTDPAAMQMSLQTPAPAASHLILDFQVEVPVDVQTGADKVWLVDSGRGNDERDLLGVRVDRLAPVHSSVLARLDLVCDRVLARALIDLDAAP